MIKFAYIGFAIAMIAYLIGLIWMDEMASDIGNGILLGLTVLLLLRIDARLGAAGAEGSESSN